MNPALVVVGSLNMDFLVTVERLPAPGETVLGRDFQMVPGGKGANQACAAARLAGPSMTVRMVGRVGYDWFGDHLKAALAAVGVDVSSVHATRAQATGVALIWVDGSGQNSIVVAPGANHALAASEMEGHRRSFQGTRFALFQLEIPLPAVAAGLRIAREEGARTMLDPAPARPLEREVLELADVLTPNETEASLLVGRKPGRVAPADAPGLARALRQAGARTVVLKLGDQGCYYDDGHRQIHQPAFPVDVRDSTAAGDTFNAALAVALCEGLPIERALRFANAAAAISVTRLGAQASVPLRREVEEFLSLREA
ncbi:MAG: ribokinase [Bryobacterales bacterium]|nr:ribokinase [Bryobacteraceae bacterium]MDW8129161.1 ribokinase [Bryobacterales bacterium]